MSRAFGSLYYTDCRPGQGLRGGAGFQFQAVSPGVSHEVMSLVQRSSLYEAPVSWMREHRPAKDYPPSLTHVYDGVYVTARGVYLGAEANGVREGNQFTHAIATDDPDTYGLVRPAQLWDAPWWSEQPAQGTECETVAAEPETGPWGTEAIREWVLGQPDGEDWLLAVHSAMDRVHDESRRRVLFVGSDAVPVLCWIAAGTLLLPQARALRIGFRVFATNPRYTDHDVLALHPDWAGQLANPHREGEFVVFNLDTGARSAVEPTEAARHWVPRFLRADPYDVIDAVELTQQFAQAGAGGAAEAHEVRPSPVDLLASRIVVLGEPVDGERAGADLAHWLAGRPPRATVEVVQPVADAVLAGPVTVPILRELDGAVHRHGQAGALAARVRRSLLDAEISDLLSDHSAPPTTRSLPPVAWSAPEAEAIVGQVEQAANAVAPQRLDLLLRTAARFGVEPRAPAMREGINRFVRWWADHPDAEIEPDSLPCGSALIDQLRDELALRFQGPAADRTTAAICGHWWRRLWPTVLDPSTPLDSTVAAAAVQRGGAIIRGEVLLHVMAQVRRIGGVDAPAVAWAASFGYAPPELFELKWFLSKLPPGDVSAIAHEAYQVVDQATRSELSADSLDVLAMLAERGARPPQQPRLATVASQDASLREWLATLGTVQQGAKSPSTRALRVVSGPVLRIRAGAVLDALLTGTSLVNAAQAAQHGGADLHALLARELPKIWFDQEDPRGDTAVALAYLAAPTWDTHLAEPMDQALVRWAQENRAKHLDIELLLKTVDPKHAKTWWEDLHAVKARDPEPDRPRVQRSIKDDGGDPKQAKSRRWFGPWWGKG